MTTTMRSTTIRTSTAKGCRQTSADRGRSDGVDAASATPVRWVCDSANAEQRRPSRRPASGPANDEVSRPLVPASERDPDTSGRHAVHAPMLLTVRDVEAELQLGRTRTYELLRSGEVPVIRVGRVLRVPRDALRRWIENQTG